jgi:hypothetical protein
MTNYPEPTFVKDNNLKAKEHRLLAWCLLFISIGYQYKLIFCGGMGLVLGQKWICYSMVHGITTNHWFEHLIYVPLMWIALNKVNDIVFGPNENEVISKSLRRQKWIGQLLAAIYIYGHGMHIMNTVELWSRINHGITSGPVYEQIWWIDEQLSHIVLFFSFFFLLAWFIAHDRLDRNQAKTMAVLTGVLHGVDRGVGVVEGDSVFSSLFFIAMILIAAIFRWYRHNQDFARSWKDFFFRHATTFSISMILFLLCYNFLFGLSVQPSEMGEEVKGVVVLGIGLIVFMIFSVFTLDKLTKKSRTLEN